MIKAERYQARCTNVKPRYAEIWEHGGKPVVIMGNTVKTRKDDTRWIWAADWTTGERVNAPLVGLSPAAIEQPSLTEVVRQIENWARNGNADAMWWLGDFYEHGSSAIGVNGGKALAYYLGAIRCMPEWYERETVERVLHDGCNLFKSGHPECVADHTPTDKAGFLNKFREYRELKTHSHIFFPDNNDWQECIAIAESLSASQDGVM